MVETDLPAGLCQLVFQPFDLRLQACGLLPVLVAHTFALTKRTFDSLFEFHGFAIELVIQLPHCFHLRTKLAPVPAPVAHSRPLDANTIVGKLTVILLVKMCTELKEPSPMLRQR